MHYQYPFATTFPDKTYLEELVSQQEKRFRLSHDTLGQLLTYASSQMNWIADYILDPSMQWKKEELAIDSLYLTGTTPEWNKVIIDQCERSPASLRVRFRDDAAMIPLFEKAMWHPAPILVHFETEKYKVFDGMHRVVAAIRDGKESITAYVAYASEQFRPVCEPHVVYDLLRAYIRKVTTDRTGLIASLRYLRGCYVNVDDLLRNRFNEGGVPDKDIQAIIEEALKD